MKKISKFLGILLIMALVMSMGITAAFAADYSITVTNDNTAMSINGKQYKAYKVFDLTLGDATTTGEGDDAVTTYGAYAYSIKNTDWAWATLTTGATTDATTGIITTKYGIKLIPSSSDATNYVVDGETMTEANARSLADALQSVLPATADGTSAAAANEKATIDLTAPGYYAVYGVVIPKDPNQNPAEEIVAAVSLTTTDPTADVKPKASVPTLNKKITGEHVLDEAGKAATAEIGKTVSFQLDSVVPDLTGYSKYTFIIGDTMTSGLTFTDPEGDATNDIVVKINGVDKTSNVTVAVTGQSFTVTIPYDVLNAATKGQPIVVTYSAVVNSTALTTDYEKNTAKLTYSHSPYDDSTNETPEKTVYVIDVDINVNKVANSNSGDTLKDAKFKVFKGSTTPADADLAWYKWDSTKKVVTWVAKADADEFVTGTDGKFTPAVQGLEAEKTGTAYGLLETAAPKGYNLLSDPVIVTLTGSYAESSGAETATVTASGAAVTNGTVTLSAEQNANQPLATATVINNSGTELPSTGGIGTTIFYVVGSILVVAAGVLLITKKRMSREG